MENIRLELIDNDQHVRAEAELSENGKIFREFLEKLAEEIVPGENAHVEVQGIKMAPLIFEVSHSE